MAALSEGEVAAFNRDGFLFPLEINSASKADLVRRRWDELEMREKLAGKGDLLYNRHLDQEFLWEIASEPKILDAIEALLGPNILLFGSRVICKWPSDGSRVSWHQDLSARKELNPAVQITAWYAIDDTDEENGCLLCVPGSHRHGMLAREPAAVKGNLLRFNEESQISKEMAESAKPIKLRAGQISLHAGLTIHSSARNRSVRRRCGLVLRYAPAYVRQGAGVEFNQRETAIVLRGVDELNGTEASAERERMRLSFRR